MLDSLKQLIGFLCRWTLLAMATGTMAAVVWAGALAAQEVASDVDAVMVIPDKVLAGWSKLKWRGQIDPPGPRRSTSAALAYRPGGPALFACTYGKWIYLQVDRVHTGLNRVTVKGVPYGAFAYKRVQALLCIIPAETDLFLLDARMALAVGDLGHLAGCLEELRGRGQPVFFHAGPVDEFLEIRRSLRRLESITPMTCEMLSKPRAFVAVRRLAGRLGRYRKGAQKPFLVTADIELARRASKGKKGFPTYLITSPPAKALSGRVHQLESLAKFKEYLAGQSISQ